MVMPATDPLHTNLASASEGRLDALRRTQLLDTPAEPAFGLLTELVSKVLRIPSSE